MSERGACGVPSRREGGSALSLSFPSDHAGRSLDDPLLPPATPINRAPLTNTGAAATERRRAANVIRPPVRARVPAGAVRASGPLSPLPRRAVPSLRPTRHRRACPTWIGTWPWSRPPSLSPHCPRSGRPAAPTASSRSRVPPWFHPRIRRPSDVLRISLRERESPWKGSPCQCLS